MNSAANLCLRKNYQILLILTYWSYTKWNDVLHTLNINKILAKKHQVVQSWVVHEISVFGTLFGKYLEYALLTLCNHKKLKRTKLSDLHSFYFKYALNLSDNCRTIWTKMKIFPLIMRFLHKLWYIVTSGIYEQLV